MFIFYFFIKVNPLPDTDDVSKISKYLIKELEEERYEVPTTREVYRQVVHLLQARLLAYNKRRPNEIEMLL